MIFFFGWLFRKSEVAFLYAAESLFVASLAVLPARIFLHIKSEQIAASKVAKEKDGGNKTTQVIGKRADAVVS